MRNRSDYYTLDEIAEILNRTKRKLPIADLKNYIKDKYIDKDNHYRVMLNKKEVDDLIKLERSYKTLDGLAARSGYNIRNVQKRIKKMDIEVMTNKDIILVKRRGNVKLLKPKQWHKALFFLVSKGNIKKLKSSI